MKFSEKVKPVSYLKSHVSEIIRNAGEDHEPYIITHNGQARVVVVDIETYQKNMETMALLKLLAMGNLQVERGSIVSADSVISNIINDIEIVTVL